MIILITGASSGIGFDTAQTLARQGHKVYAAARRVERMEPLRADGVVPMMMDVTDEQSMEHGVQTVIEAEGRIDVLVNNAGFGYFGAIENVTMEEAREQMEVNIFGMARLCQLVIPIMRKQWSGRIVNVSSVAGKIVLPFGGWYHVSKFSVEALSDAMRMELKPFGIYVTKIEPGAIRTNWGIIAAQNLMNSSMGTPYSEEAMIEGELMEKHYPSKLLSSPHVVARAISKAVNRRRPRPYYRIGRFAHLCIVAHAVLPTRWWDAFTRRLLVIRSR